MANFPHLNDTQFPNIDTVDPFKFVNDYDYSRFDNVQMVIRVLNVPWDLGEVHVGNRTVGGIGNVVKFESDDARDAWFSSKRYASTPEQAATGTYDGFVWETQFREFHDEDEIYIPLPFDVAARYNYITVEYMPAPNSDFPVDYETERGLLKWFYFSRAVESAAVNTTRCIVRRDTWQTYINRVSIPYMILDRGHAPMAAAANVDTYLQSPVQNNRYLTTPDVDYSNGNSRRVASSSSVVLNSEAYYAVIVTTANVAGSWGTQGAASWTTPANPYNTSQGQPSANAFAIRATALNAFLNNVNSNVPQFIQTVQAVFFASRELVDLGGEFTFGGQTCNWLVEKSNRKSLLTLNKAAFGFGSKYANLAKLYTYPYSQIVITNERGDTSYINVEECDGELELDFKLSFAWPWLNIAGHLLGVGGSSTNSISFSNLNSHSFTFGGAWYDYLQAWQIPTFALTQSARDVTTYSTFYDRAQGYLQNTTALQNALDTNATSKTNADASADNDVANALVTTTANTAITTRSNTSIDNMTTYDNAMGGYNALVANKVTEDTTNASIDYERQSASIAAASSAVSGVTGALTSGNPAGAISSLVSGAVSAASNIAQADAAIHLSETRAGLTIASNNAGVLNTTENNRNKALVTKNCSTDNTITNNNSITTQTANNAALQKNNATRDKTTGDAIANREKATADAAIVAAFDSASLNAPFQYGDYNGGDTSTTRPLGMFANVITQSVDAIEQAGDYFLKYGYAYKGNWNFESFNVMPKFSYWRCDDLTVRGLDVPDLYMDEIRFFLLGGVTVWREPEDIGNISIYENN